MNNTTDKYEEFIASLSSDNSSASVAKSFSALGQYDYTDCDTELVIQAILSVKLKSNNHIKTVCSYLKRYAEFIGNQKLVEIVDNLDKRKLLERIGLESEYISYSQLCDILRDIEDKEKYNKLYYKSLFWAIYEGVYNHDMSVISNLKASDVDGEYITLHNNSDEVYKLTIPKQLSEYLILLSEESVWEQEGTFNIPLVGDSSDTCFKISYRKNRKLPDNKVEAREKIIIRYKEYYYRRIRTISNKYVGFNISAQNIYVSGIMYRLKKRLNEAGYSLQDAFRFNRKNREISSIIHEELMYSHYWGTVKSFRQKIVGHLNVFEE